ncbi:hypothetical protein ONZ43_g4626 [Nemania bipapillata]|uniref:Uncharacterized protein n=1 Tax=Nemania bipapillata TaxID=110536 RepID=A0ACC2IKJ0_9PEZI|nr:hypothetical protein ONZ43_g4626 [Nemania bipapillata]
MVISKIPARNYKDQYNRSLLKDLEGQITEGLSTQKYFFTWGCHYFLSLWNAHEKQLCNSFKDAGPLMYNQNKFFIQCRNTLDKAFDDTPPPIGRSKKPVEIERYNSFTNGCFAASSLVLLATGYKVPVCTLQKGLAVHTPVGPRRVRALVKIPVQRSLMCRMGDLVLTPWHPIRTPCSRNNEWDFPINVAEQTMEYSGTICSVLLEPDGDADAHAIWVGDAWGVTLGHGMLTGSDVRAHEFLGDYNAIAEGLATLEPGEDGVFFSAGVRRDADTGRVCGFERLPPVRTSGVEGTDQTKPSNELATICV